MCKKFFCLALTLLLFLSAAFPQVTTIDNATLSTPQENIELGDDIKGYTGENDPGDLSADADAGSSAGALFKMVLMLALVVAIIYGISRFFKKSMKSANDDDPFLRQVSKITLSAGKSVQVVTLLDKAYLIGVTDNNISLLGEVEDKELINSMNLYSDKKNNSPKPRTFADILNIFMPGSSRRQESVFRSNQENASEFLRKQRDRLHGEE